MSAKLKSNDGGSLLEIIFESKSEYAHEPGFESTVCVKGRHWDGDHTFPQIISIEGLWLRIKELRELRNHIGRWTDQALDELRIEDLSEEFELARLPHQSLRLLFGPRPDTISDSHPVVSISLAAGPMKAEYHFLTDQSCLSLFSDELTREIKP